MATRAYNFALAFLMLLCTRGAAGVAHVSACMGQHWLDFTQRWGVFCRALGSIHLSLADGVARERSGIPYLTMDILLGLADVLEPVFQMRGRPQRGRGRTRPTRRWYHDEEHRLRDLLFLHMATSDEEDRLPDWLFLHMASSKL